MLAKHVIRTISKQNPATGRYNFPGIKNTNINNIAATTITNFSSLCNNIDEANDTVAKQVESSEIFVETIKPGVDLTLENGFKIPSKSLQIR